MTLLDNNSHCLMYVCMYVYMYVCGSLVDGLADNCETIARPQRDYLRIALSAVTLICQSIYISHPSMYVCMYVCIIADEKLVHHAEKAIHTYIHSYIHEYIQLNNI